MLENAQDLDRQDPVSSQRSHFSIPTFDDGTPQIYFCGNSLGLQPLKSHLYVDELMNAWSRHGVHGHFDGSAPWYPYHELFRASGARLVGAAPPDRSLPGGEVVMMNSLTVNLHLLLTSFYQPTGRRRRILMESPAFPSDIYCIQSHLQARGLDPIQDVITVGPREGEDCLRNSDILEAIEQAGDTLATVMLGGVNFLTGQVLDMPEIVRAGHQVGAMVGFDLAHAAGNIPLHLHDWDVDFAAWCSYKYLNAGPGAIAGAFVHARHGMNTSLPRLAGWWGNDPDTRFRMHLESQFLPVAGAEGWQLSNPPILAMAPLRASLELFDSVGMDALHERSKRMTNDLRDRLESHANGRWRVITPAQAQGCQLSIVTRDDAKAAFDALTNQGVTADFRPPHVIRVAPVPLYNTYEDGARFVSILSEALT